MYSKDKFIELIKKANWVSWDSKKSSMLPLIDMIPEGGAVSRKQMIDIQGVIWPVGDNPTWIAKKQKYKEALIYLVWEVLSMPRGTADRVLCKKGESKIRWTPRLLPNDRIFTHTTTIPNLTNLDPKLSREFCYPDEGMWYDWPTNEFVFCIPQIDQQVHKQKDFSTFGATKLTFTIPTGTPYFGNTDIAVAKGEIAFPKKLLFATDPVTVVDP